MDAIAISFTLKGQNFLDILPKLEYIASLYPSPVILVHGFMPRDVLQAKNIPTTVVDELKRLFPVQLNMYANGSVLRTEMTDVLRKLGGKVYVIGEQIEGVEDEVCHYAATGLEIVSLPLGDSL